ncbi:hypothetical protein [Novosphingobium sp.]|uniref:hypothetical protein n=1 Tax=Novosphingobium sp. TaxID=1874826 RepID=UPI0025F8F21A|nr:hypothetical protein [Novosphingobium sp.]
MSGGVVAIVIVAIITSMIVRLVKIQHGMNPDRRHRRGQSQALLDPAQPTLREQELQREVEDLRERIHVLERIATDDRKPQALADEIERLRDR